MLSADVSYIITSSDIVVSSYLSHIYICIYNVCERTVVRVCKLGSLRLKTNTFVVLLSKMAVDRRNM